MVMQLAWPLALAGALLVAEVLLWAIWRLLLRLTGRDVALFRRLLLPLRWLGRLGSRTPSEGEPWPAGHDGLLRQAVALRSEGNLEEAAKLFGRAGNRLSFRRDRQLVAEISLDRALCLEQLGRTDEALYDWERAAAIAGQLESSFLEIRLAYCRGLIERRRGRPQAAITWLERARAASRDTGSQRIPAVSGMTEDLIALYRQQGQRSRAIALCQVALNEWGWSGNKYKQADVMCELAELFAEAGDLPASLRMLRQIRTMASILPYRVALDRADATLRAYHSETLIDDPPRLAVGQDAPARGAEIIRFPRRRD